MIILSGILKLSLCSSPDNTSDILNPNILLKSCNREISGAPSPVSLS